ncbi:MAG: response regulator [Verrucomicrobiota bacterium]
MKLLIVEDSEPDRFYFSMIASRSGRSVEILEAQNGKEGLEQISDTVDIIFLDINMPIMNGLEFVAAYSERLKNSSEPKEIPVYITSSSQNKAEIEQITSYSFVKEFIEKPIDKDYLTKLLEKYAQ